MSSPTVRPRPALERAATWSRVHALDLALVAALIWLCFPHSPQHARSGLDPSWVVGLNLAAADGIHFGTQLVFTYGPLGFASIPTLVSPGFWMVGLALSVLVLAALVATVYGLLVQTLPRWAAFAVAAVALPVVAYSPEWYGAPLATLAPALAVIWALRIAAADDPPRPVLAVGAGLLTSVTVLVKLDAGALCGVSLAIAIAANGLVTRQWRATLARLAAFAGTAVAAFALLWVLLGQPLRNITTWFATAAQIASGYASAMGVEDPTRRWEYLAAAGLIVVVVACLASTTDLDRRRRLAVGVVIAPVLFVAFRQGFVRHDAHAATFFATLVFAAVGLLGIWGWPRSLLLGSVSLVVFVLVAGVDLPATFDPAAHLRAPVDTARLVADPGARADFIEQSRDELRDIYAIDPALIAAADGRTIHVLPFDLAVLYAYPQLDWQPLPVFQNYSAYTTELDDLNAQALTGDGKPELLLRSDAAPIDGRFLRWEPPASTLAVACNYRELMRSGVWTLLQAVPDRCGDPTPLGTVEAHFGEPVDVPTAGGLVVARFEGIDSSPLDRIRTALFKSPPYWVRGSDATSWSRFVPGTQGSWHVVRAPACATDALGTGTDWDLDSIDFSTSSTHPAGHDAYTVEFAEVPYEC